jgi:hypothetical protein
MSDIVDFRGLPYSQFIILSAGFDGFFDTLFFAQISEYVSHIELGCRTHLCDNISTS